MTIKELQDAISELLRIFDYRTPPDTPCILLMVNKISLKTVEKYASLFDEFTVTHIKRYTAGIHKFLVCKNKPEIITEIRVASYNDNINAYRDLNIDGLVLVEPKLLSEEWLKQIQLMCKANFSTECALVYPTTPHLPGVIEYGIERLKGFFSKHTKHKNDLRPGEDINDWFKRVMS